MRKSNREVNGEKVFRYSIRKYHFGAASVAVAALMFFANGAVKADSSPVPPATTANTEKVNAGVEGVPPEKSLEAEGNKGIVAPEPAEETSNKKDGAQSNPTPAKEGKIEPEKPKDTVNKAKLETLIKEVKGLNLEKYTEESVKGLKTELAKAKEVFETAQNKEEVEAAWRTLFTYKNSKLVVKKTPKLPQDNTPKPDTTNGKETAGIRAENTEPNGTNIAGHNHSMNGTTRSEGSGFRNASTELTDVEIGRWNATRKKFDEGNVYGVLPGDNLRNNSLKIKVKSPNANITKLTVTKKEGGNFPGEHTTGIGGKEADLYFEGDLPNSGSWLMEVTAETTKGIKKFEFGVYTHFQAPKITTENSALVGKANEKPDIDVEIPSVPKLPEGSRMMLYVVGRGAVDYGEGFEPDPAYSLVKAKKQIASGKEGTGGKKTVTITENDYTVEKLGTEPFKVLTVIELIGSDGNYKEDHRPGLRGSFYSSLRSATEAPTVDKSGAINAITTEAEKQNRVIDSKQNVLTSTEVSAFKKMVTDAANEAKNNINKTDTDTDTKVNTERDKGILALDKIGAIAEIDAAQKAKDTAIEGNANITDKATAKAATKAAADAAKAEINKDTTNTADKVTTEKAKGLLGIEKAGAIAEIDAAQKAKDTAIEGNANITDKATAKAATKAAADAAKAEINKDTTNTADKVTTEKDKGLLGIEKAGAIAEIDAVAEIKKTEISQRYDLVNKSKDLEDLTKITTYAIENVKNSNTSDEVERAKDSGIKSIRDFKPRVLLYTPSQAEQSQPSTPTQPDQGSAEIPTIPSKPSPQPSQPARHGSAPSLAPTQDSRVIASPSAVSTSTQALASAQEQVDKSELRALSYELDERLKVLTKVSDAKIDAAKTVLLDAKKAISDSDLTEQGLRDAVEAVKKALASLKDVKVNDVDSKTAQDKSDVKKVAEDSKDSDKMSETNSVPVGVFVAGLLALLGVIIFWLIGRKKESELKQLSIELTKILEQLDAAKADKKVLAKAQKLLQETLDFMKEESGSAETEAKLVEQLKAIITNLK